MFAVHELSRAFFSLGSSLSSLSVTNAMKITFIFLCSVVATVQGVALTSRATCGQNPHPVANENFYGYGTQQYTPWTLNHVSGASGCQYVQGSYGLCGGPDPDCL